MNVQGRKKQLTSAQIIIFGFMAVILFGAFLSKGRGEHRF